MSPPRFLLDEHVSRAIQSQLLRLDAEIDVAYTFRDLL
jgi:hypothetical protein